ncbi:DUF4321 domain-containing protein [Sedimentibacter sp. zth1]|uniref:DUF4321 domain-containing protein n=1 Tax=Sedimentibacter sp. zth1 TaxID=2816908 RepID=UPI001A90F46D|nr:DUF4321 domain-containing protein [Sedimentibacter sp. zth1]QSX06207.1 DUF4321 domain-containing protein [Sedimentibacter sp. zth1]
MKRGSSIAWIIVILAGSIFGNIIGTAFSKYAPLLTFGESIGFGPMTVDLNIIKFTIGFNASLTISAIIGIILAILIYKRVSR